MIQGDVPAMSEGPDFSHGLRRPWLFSAIAVFLIQSDDISPSVSLHFSCNLHKSILINHILSRFLQQCNSE